MKYADGAPVLANGTDLAHDIVQIGDTSNTTGRLKLDLQSCPAAILKTYKRFVAKYQANRIKKSQTKHRHIHTALMTILIIIIIIIIIIMGIYSAPLYS